MVELLTIRDKSCGFFFQMGHLANLDSAIYNSDRIAIAISFGDGIEGKSTLYAQ
jgi:hypothetical protein